MNRNFVFTALGIVAVMLSISGCGASQPIQAQAPPATVTQATGQAITTSVSPVVSAAAATTATPPPAAGSTAATASVAPSPVPAVTGTPADTAVADPTPVLGGQTIRVVAKGKAFDTNYIDVVAYSQVNIIFENQDTDATYNISIYTGSGDPYFIGEPVKGPGTIIYQFTTPGGPDNFTFRCDSHPESMSGTLAIASCCG